MTKTVNLTKRSVRFSSMLDRSAGDADLWAFKRRKQSSDMLAAARGQVSHDQLSWFAGGKARDLKLIGSPY
ncbi:hypothetical protein [Roseateles sp.]|uniref:hypothetical protein n=1 Tax=Roseateles sp. TaxID=1971397 RepID=UPI003BAB51D7